MIEGKINAVNPWTGYIDSIDNALQGAVENDTVVWALTYGQTEKVNMTYGQWDVQPLRWRDINYNLQTRNLYQRFVSSPFYNGAISIQKAVTDLYERIFTPKYTYQQEDTFDYTYEEIDAMDIFYTSFLQQPVMEDIPNGAFG